VHKPKSPESSWTTGGTTADSVNGATASKGGFSRRQWRAKPSWSGKALVGPGASAVKRGLSKIVEMRRIYQRDPDQWRFFWEQFLLTAGFGSDAGGLVANWR